MWKLTVLLMLATLSLAQDSGEVPPYKENESVITSLDLSNKGITSASLHDYDFSKYPSLEELDLSNNEIEHIPTEIFSKNPDLKKLDLSGNTNLELPRFNTLLDANIEELNLSNCSIDELPLSIFDGMVHLRTIDLANNPLQQDEAIQVATLLNLHGLQKIILPHVDEILIGDICKECSIVIEVDYETRIDSVQCADVNRGLWHMERKEKSVSNNDIHHEETEPDHEDSPHVENEEIQTHLDIENESKVDSAESDNKENRKRQTSADETDVEQPAEADGQESKADEIPLHEEEPSSTDSAPVEPEPEHADTENSEGNSNPNPNPEDNVDGAPTEAPANEDGEDTKTDSENADPTHDDEAPASENEDAAPTEEPVNIPDAPASPDLNIPDNVTTAESPEVPDTIDGRFNPGVHEHHEERQPTDQPPNENLELDKENKAADQARGAPMQRGLVPPAANNTEQQKAVSTENPSEKIQDGTESKGQTRAAEAADTNSSSTGTNILIFLVVAVVVAGVAAFGYKFYKTRTYQAAHTCEPVERELKEIVVDKKSNGPNPDGAILEQQPLMQKRGNSVEIKEINETNEIQSQAPKDVQENNETPKAISNEARRSGPYMPTTTPVKPDTDSKSVDTA